MVGTHWINRVKPTVCRPANIDDHSASKMNPQRHLSSQSLIIVLLLFSSAIASKLTDWMIGDDWPSPVEQARAQQRTRNNCGTHQARSSRSSHRIAGGYSAKPGEYPSFVQIEVIRENGLMLRCGGVIISEWLVLTAAHCITHSKGLKLKAFQVIVGSVNFNAGSRMDVKQYCLPDGFIDYWKSEPDMAVLVTKQPIKFDQFAQPACLPTLGVNSSYQTHVVGFAPTTPKGDRNRGPAKQLQVLPVTRYSCNGRKSIICFKSNNPKHRGATCPGRSSF